MALYTLGESCDYSYVINMTVFDYIYIINMTLFDYVYVINLTMFFLKEDIYCKFSSVLSSIFYGYYLGLTCQF